MLPIDKNNRKEYITLHYKILEKYRKKYNKYIPFRLINKSIKRHYQLYCYNKINKDSDIVKEKQTMIRWSENNLEHLF